MKDLWEGLESMRASVQVLARKYDWEKNFAQLCSSMLADIKQLPVLVDAVYKALLAAAGRYFSLVEIVTCYFLHCNQVLMKKKSIRCFYLLTF